MSLVEIKPHPQNTLIVFALECEAQERFIDLCPIYSGVGKVNAAYNLARKIAQLQHDNGKAPELVLNVGSAGSTHFKAGTVVNCTRFVQRDFDATALGVAPYVTPFEDCPVFLANGMRYLDFPEGVCGTGDNFATNGLGSEWNVVDMEAYALAKICKLENIPFGCLKYITDGADGQAATSWEAGLLETAKKLHEAVTTIFGTDEESL